MPSFLASEFTGYKIKVIQSPGSPTARTINNTDQLLIVIPAKATKATWDALPDGNKLQDLCKRSKDGHVPVVSSRLTNKRQSGVHVGTLPADSSAFDTLSFARKMLAAALTEKISSVSLWVEGFADEQQASIAESLVAAALAAGFIMPTCKSKSSPQPFTTLRVIGLSSKLDLARVQAEAAGNNLARALTSLPPNKLDATAYCDILRSLARDRGWQFKQFSTAELKKKGAGAFLAVAQGND
ncbi:MAG: hypothetical protein RIA65_09705, partial [Woeseia sp.]